MKQQENREDYILMNFKICVHVMSQ